MDLEQFRRRWNKHKIRTATHATPEQLCFRYAHLSAAVNVRNQNNLEEAEAVNDDAVYPQVNTEPVRCPLTPIQLIFFKEHVTVLTLNDTNIDIIWQRIERALDIYDYCMRHVVDEHF